MSVEDNRIDIQSLMHYLDECFRQDGTVDLKVYLQAFRVLHRFFTLLGKIFGFVATDIQSKIGILDRYLQSENQNAYETINSMVTYEISHDLLNKKEPSGSRTLLRLHRALEFVLMFLEKVKDLEDHENTCPSSQESYKKTLGKYHPWLIQKAALLAMHTLPTAEGLVKTTCKQPIEEVRRALPRIIDVGKTVYDATQTLYRDNSCLDLP